MLVGFAQDQDRMVEATRFQVGVEEHVGVFQTCFDGGKPDDTAGIDIGCFH